MTDQVADALRWMILSRDLQSGQRITQPELAVELGVSTMPGREALLRLMAEGLVEATSRRAFRIVETTEQDVRDVYWVHAQLVGELTVRAWDRRTGLILAGMAEHHRDYLDVMASGGRDRLVEASWSFHAVVNKAAESPTIQKIFKNTRCYLPDFSYDVPGWVELETAWQSGLIRQFTHGSRSGAHRVAVSSIGRAADLFVEWFWGARGA